MVIETLYKFGDTVFHRLGEQPEGIVTGLTIRPAGKTVSVVYEVTFEDRVSSHFEFELIAEKTFVNETEKE